MGRRVRPERVRKSSVEGNKSPVIVGRPKKKTMTEPLWINKRNYLYLCFGWRLLSVFFIQTEFVPDEAWQSTEVAYYFTYGRGHLTWEWTVGLRNHIYPLCIAAIYSVLKFFGADTPYWLIVAPRLFQACITAIGDYSFFLYCVNSYGFMNAKFSLLCSLTNWFSFYCGARTITNTTEMALNCVCMYLLQIEQMAAFTGIVAFNFVIRPTALVVWIPQAHIILGKFFPRKIPHRIPACLMIGIATVLLASLVDSKIFGQPVMAWFRFIKFNFLEGKSSQFGEHHVLWYFYSGMPSILGPTILPLIFSLYYKLHVKEWTTIIGFIFIFSLIGHKEIRFLLPVLPYVFAVMGTVMCKIYEVVIVQMKGIADDGTNIGRMFMQVSAMFLGVNFLAASYFCAFHQGGIYPITNYVNNASHNISHPRIWVMMSCYSVPVFTYMHNPQAQFQFMTCGPDGLELEKSLPNFRRYTTNVTELKEFVYEKEAQGFKYPHFILSFDEITTKLIDVFSQTGIDYKICETRPHAQFGEDRGMVNVLCVDRVRLEGKKTEDFRLQDET